MGSRPGKMLTWEWNIVDCFTSPSLLFLVFQDCWSQYPEEWVTVAAAVSGVGRLLDNLFQELGVPGVLSQCILKVKGSKTHSFFQRPFFLSFQWWWSSVKTNECYNSLHVEWKPGIWGVLWGSTQECRISLWKLPKDALNTSHFLPQNLIKNRENKTFVIQFQVFL